MTNLFEFIRTKLFLKHITLSFLALAVVLWLLFKGLNIYTHHGETAEVPDFIGKSIPELTNFLVDKNVRYLIIDSIYDPKQKPGTIIKQDPEAKSLVKHNRLVYLYVISMQAPQIAMPKLVDRSTRQALFMIESYGLKSGNVREVAADCKGCVVRQLYDGKEIVAGELIKKGSKIDLEVGKKAESYQAISPDSIDAGGNFD